MGRVQSLGEAGYLFKGSQWSERRWSKLEMSNSASCSLPVNWPQLLLGVIISCFWTRRTKAGELGMKLPLCGKLQFRKEVYGWKKCILKDPSYLSSHAPPVMSDRWGAVQKFVSSETTDTSSAGSKWWFKHQVRIFLICVGWIFLSLLLLLCKGRWIGLIRILENFCPCQNISLVSQYFFPFTVCPRCGTKKSTEEVCWLRAAGFCSGCFWHLWKQERFHSVVCSWKKGAMLQWKEPFEWESKDSSSALFSSPSSDRDSLRRQ